MANKDVYTATRVDQPRDFYIRGEARTAQAGSYLLYDADGNLEILSSTAYEQGYADAGTGVVGEVTKIKPNKRADKVNATENELELTPPSTDVVPTDDKIKAPAAKTPKGKAETKPEPEVASAEAPGTVPTETSADDTNKES